MLLYVPESSKIGTRLKPDAWRAWLHYLLMDQSEQYKDIRTSAENAVICLELALRHVESALSREFSSRPTPEFSGLRDTLHETALEFSRARLKILQRLRLPVKTMFIVPPTGSPAHVSQHQGNC